MSDNTGRIGVQLYGFREAIKEMGVTAVMERLADLGFHSVEISAVEMTAENVAAFQDVMARRGMKAAAMSAGLEAGPGGGENLTDHYEKIVADCKALDCRFLRIGIMPPQYMQSYESAMEFIQRAEAMAKRLHEDGIELYYHNHHVEFARYNGELLFDLIRKNTQCLGFEIDVHWCWRGGVNPLDVIQRFAGRVKLLHLKDYRIANFQLPSKEDGPEGFHKAFNGVVQFAELGEGTLDIPAVIQAGIKAGSEYFLVELDDSYGRDPFDSLEISRDYLRKIGYGEWL